MKKIWVILGAGIILRLILAFTTYHSDIEVFNLAGRLVSFGNILNLYDFSSNQAVFNYPPAIYIFHGFFRILFNLFGLEGLAFLKGPYLIFDLTVAYIFLKIFEDPKRRMLAITLWIFNPVSLYATYMMGQFDIIPATFVILSVYLAFKNKLNYSALALGCGIAFKIFPIFLIIPLLILGKNYLERLKLFLLAILPYIVSILPYLSSQSFKATALFANQSSKSLYADIPVSGGESILLFPALLLIFYIFIWQTRIKIEIWKLYLIPLLLFFIFTHYHPQWLLWVTPLLIFDLINSGFKNLLVHLLILVSWVMSLFFFDPSLTIGIFAPLAPSLQDMPSIWNILNINLDYNLSRSIIQTITASALGYLVYLHFPRKAHDIS